MEAAQKRQRFTELQSEQLHIGYIRPVSKGNVIPIRSANNG
jgi:hypothetical protein